MRIMWLDRLEEMLAAIKISKSAIWDRNDIQDLFDVGASTARKILLAATRINVSGRRDKVVTTGNLKSLIERFAIHMSACSKDEIPRSDAITSAGVLFNSMVAETEKAEKRDTDTAVSNFSTVRKARQRKVALRLAKQKTAEINQQSTETATKDQLALPATGPILVTRDSEISDAAPSVGGELLADVRPIRPEDEQYRLIVFERAGLDLEPSKESAKRQKRIKKEPSSQRNDLLFPQSTAS